MGLDVTAYADAEFVRPDYDDERDWPTLVNVYTLKDFAEYADGLREGAYRTGEAYGWRAGSYGGYNVWREWLASVLGDTTARIWRDPRPGSPFVELINNSDCEGTIGPKTSAKLAADFERWQSRAKDMARDGDPNYFLEQYDYWARGFTLASRNGFVKLH